MADEKSNAEGQATAAARQASDSATTSAPTSPSAISRLFTRLVQLPVLRRIWWAVTWVPPNCRWDPEKPPQFSMSLNIIFAFAGAFTVANLYYSHPILNILANDFHVEYEKVAQIPTLAQAGYAVGLLLLCPLGDLFKRRPFVIWLVCFTATVWLGLCLTTSLNVFSAISFITGVTTVTPQLMLPLVGDLAPPHKRATALSIVVCGLTLGILVARVLSGTMTNFVSWRYVYWMSFGLQYAIFFLLWAFMPDYPSTNPGGLNYFKLLWSIIVMIPKQPLLVQAMLISFFTSATFTSFWTTLTFLLAGPPYYYEPLIIGLFALIGIAVMVFAPLYAKNVTDKFVPSFSVLVGLTCCLIGITLGTYIGTFTVAGPILQAAFLDFGMQTAQIANRSAIYSIAPKARNRVNTAFMVATFCGQLMGTSAGNHIYASSGWIGSGSASVGFIGAAILFTLARGPYETGWVGWHGGFSIRKKDKMSADGKTAETEKRLGQIRSREEGRDEESGLGAIEKVEGEVAAEEGRESLKEKDRGNDATSAHAASGNDTPRTQGSDFEKKEDEILPTETEKR